MHGGNRLPAVSNLKTVPTFVSRHTQRDIEIERTTQDRKQWSRRYFLARYFPSNFIGKYGVRAKSQIRFFTSLTGRKNKRDIFYPARTSVLLKNLSKLDIYSGTPILRSSI